MPDDLVNSNGLQLAAALEGATSPAPITYSTGSLAFRMER